MKHVVEWHTPSPLWEKALADSGERERFSQPALLRFDSDRFMDQLLAELAADPSALSNRVAQPETWRSPAAGWVQEGDTSLSQQLKLYQPAHQRYYLVGASLVCRAPGLPDRAVNGGAGEKVGFVLRRVDPDTGGEYAWAGTTTRAWSQVSDEDDLVDDEEILPLFPLPCVLARGNRKLWMGFLPVASRETYVAGPTSSVMPSAAELSDDPMADRRLSLYEQTVQVALDALRDATPGALPSSQARDVLLFLSLDLAQLLQDELPAVWAVVQGKLSSSALTTGQRALWDSWLKKEFGDRDTRWADLLKDCDDLRDEITEGTSPGSYPTAGWTTSQIQSGVSAVNTLVGDESTLLNLMEAALAEVEDEAASSPPTIDGATIELPKVEDGTLFVVRCVYQRPACEGIHTPLVSEASRAFTLASFFDPDAPTRKLTLALPVDTSLRGLRKFPKNVSVMLSDQLRNQLARVQGLKLSAVEDGDLNDDPGLTLGEICTLSIPIITLCALILLIVLVFVLNIVFWWLPLFKICFPLKLKAR